MTNLVRARVHLQVHDLDAAILRPGLLVAARGRRTLFAVAHRGQLRLRRHPAAPARGAPPARGARRDRCCTRASRARRCALRGAPSCSDCRRGSGMRRDDVGELGADVAAVEIEIDDALGQQLARRTRDFGAPSPHPVAGVRVRDTAGIGWLALPAASRRRFRLAWTCSPQTSASDRPRTEPSESCDTILHSAPSAAVHIMTCDS